MSVDIVAFLTARLDEDDQLAGIATPGPWHVGEAPYRTNVVLSEDVLDRVGTAGGRMDMPAPVFTGQTASRPRSWWEADAAHIARHDPARVLAEVAAKRAIVAEYEARDKDADLMLGSDVLRQREWSGLRLAVHLLATAYAGHPDYDQSWRPDAPH